ncbi:MAG: DUF1801 domain-containing protein [Chitinophagaceae bacterium]
MSARPRFDTPDQYIKSFPADVQKILRQVQATLRKAVPGAEEVISYQIPAFKRNGWIFYYSAYQNHFSLSCPPPFTVFDVFKKELSAYKLSKSTIQFPYDQPVPVKLISDMAKYRAGQTATAVKKKTS